MICEQATLLLALLLTQSGQAGMLLGMCLRMRRLTSVGRLLLCLLLLLLLLLYRLHLAGVHLLLCLRRLARDRQVGLLRWMTRWLLLLLCRTHLVKTRWNLVTTDHMLSVTSLIELVLVVHVLRRSVCLLVHCGCIRRITGLGRRRLRLDHGRSRVHGVARLWVVL